MTIIDKLVLVLKDSSGALEELEKHGVKPEHYAAYVYDDELRKAHRVGYGVGFVLVAGLALLTFFAAKDSGAVSLESWYFGLGGGLLGLLITWGSMRRMAGKRWKYIDYPDETSSGYSLVGVLNRLRTKHLEKLGEKEWEYLRNFEPDLKAKRYQHFPTASKSPKEKAELMKMTPEKERLVAHLQRIKRWCVYLMLFVVLVPFMESLFFLFWLWFFVGIWLGLESVEGIIKRQMGAFVAANTIDLYGWPARLFAWFMLFLAVVIFVLPGILGMFASVGVDLMDLIFS